MDSNSSLSFRFFFSFIIYLYRFLLLICFHVHNQLHTPMCTQNNNNNYTFGLIFGLSFSVSLHSFVFFSSPLIISVFLSSHSVRAELVRFILTISSYSVCTYKVWYHLKLCARSSPHRKYSKAAAAAAAAGSHRKCVFIVCHVSQHLDFQEPNNIYTPRAEHQSPNVLFHISVPFATSDE